MARVVLNNIDHADLRVDRVHGAAFGDAVNQVTVFPTEFADAAREFPVFLRPDGEGSWTAMAVTGLDRDENLFLDGDRWDVVHVPLVQRRGPFAIGFQAGPDGERAPVILVDLDDPRVHPDGAGDGEPVFRPQGGNTAFLDRTADVLRALHQGVEVAPGLYAAWTDYGLIEPVTVDVRLDDGREYRLPDLHTIGEARLAALSGDALEALNRAGYLGAAFIVAASVANVQRLIERKAQRGTGRGTGDE